MTPTRMGAVAADEELDLLADEVVRRTIEIASIPAPTGDEGTRRARLAGWWEADGFEQIGTDGAGNLWACARPGDGPGIVLAAHLDTVFGSDVVHHVRRAGDRLVGPGVGDDGVALAALGAVGSLLSRAPGTAPVHLLATVGEEGLGDLVGARHAVATAPRPIGAFLAIEGNYLGRLGTIGVGSRRWQVELDGPGGHAWEAADNPSAVHTAAALVVRLAALPVAGGQSSVNIGRLEGGEAINARARHARFDLDLRAATPEDLAALVSAAEAILDDPLPEGLQSCRHPVGDRPAGRIESSHPLVTAARAALVAQGQQPIEVASSTDANAAHAAGIPAIALGVTSGSGEHTLEEWIDVRPIRYGIAALAETVLRYEPESAR